MSQRRCGAGAVVLAGLLMLQNWQVLAQDATARWEALTAQIKTAQWSTPDQAISLAQEALVLARQAFGGKDLRTLASLNDLALLLQSQGRYAEAEPLLREVLQANREVLGPRHPKTLASLTDLASLYRAQGRYVEAEPLLREALQANREVLGPRHPDMLRILSDLASSLQAQGRPDEAAPFFREVLSSRKERPPAATAPSSPPPASDTVDTVLKRLAAGIVAFNIPNHMRLARTQTLEARLGINVPLEQLVQEVTSEGEVKTVKLKVSPRMQASLSGGSAFDISPSGPQVQFVSAEEPNTWYWQITPKLEGQQVLVLAFDAFIEVNGKEGTHTVNTLRQTIVVEVGWPETPREWAEWLKKWIEYGGWLWTALLLPIGLFTLRAWSKFRAKPIETPSSASKVERL